jgi:tRNA G18 (ribose-2'-O)-methylase SpoU
MRGYFGIGVYRSKTETNVGTLLRSATLFGAAFVFVIGKRFKKQSSDTMQTWRHMPLTEYQNFDDFYAHLPYACRLIGVEQVEGKSVELSGLVHPERAVYLLGAEDEGLPPKVLEKCHTLVAIDTPRCLNVSVAGSIVMYDRQIKCR